MIPGENEWTVIFSKNSTSWGSFTYNQAEDALRVTMKPQPTESHEALTYDFDQLTPNSAVVTLRWEKVAVPFKVAMDVNPVVEASLRKQLHGLAQYTWEGWDDAATYLVDNKVDLNEALSYEDKSIQNEERFDNLMTKSRILDALGRKDEAMATRNKAMAIASPLQLHIYARQLQGLNRQEEAFTIFRSNAKKYPSQWFVYSGMARVYSGHGDFDGAVKEMKLALPSAPDQQKAAIQGMIKRLEAREDINK
jgi:tetratricopeptide (TPR) repeat protein